MQKKRVPNKFSIKGVHTVKVYDTTRDGYSQLEEKILAHIESRGRAESFEKYNKEYQTLIAGLEVFKVRECVVENIIVTRGRSVIADRLANITTYTGIINYGALGSASTTPVNGNTQLGTEVFRKITASSSVTDNIAFIDFFYSKADTNGTYNEFGTFIDGTGSANSGRLFTHALTGGWVKTSSESMTVACQYTIS